MQSIGLLCCKPSVCRVTFRSITSVGRGVVEIAHVGTVIPRSDVTVFVLGTRSGVGISVVLDVVVIIIFLVLVQIRPGSSLLLLLLPVVRGAADRLGLAVIVFDEHKRQKNAEVDEVSVHQIHQVALPSIFTQEKRLLNHCIYIRIIYCYAKYLASITVLNYSKNFYMLCFLQRFSEAGELFNEVSFTDIWK